MGALIQLGNDIYDVYKDLHEGIHTLPNRMQKVKEIENELSTRMQEFKASVRSLAVSDRKKKIAPPYCHHLCAEFYGSGSIQDPGE